MPSVQLQMHVFFTVVWWKGAAGGGADCREHQESDDREGMGEGV